MFSIIKSQYFRTIFLAILATVTFVGSAIIIFEVEPAKMWDFFLLSFFGLAFVVLLALCFTVLKVLVKRFFTQKKPPEGGC